MCLLALGSLAAQTGGERLAFDAVSIKSTEFPRPNGRGVIALQRTTGGPGSGDPGRIHYPYATLKSLVMEAYQVKDLQLEGPDWLAADRFDVTATMPPETTKEQFRQMLQTLLADRFHLACHRVTREVSTYTLVVAKGGPKLKDASTAPPPAAPDAPPSSGPMLLTQAKTADDGLPAQVFPPGKPGIMALNAKGHARLVGQLQTMANLAAFLTNFLDRPVTDGTGLTAKYDFVLDFSADNIGAGVPDASTAVDVAENPLPEFMPAMQSEMGLRLDSGKGPLEKLVIDHVDRKPVEN